MKKDEKKALMHRFLIDKIIDDKTMKNYFVVYYFVF